MKRALKSLIRYFGYELRYAEKPARFVAFDDHYNRDYERLKSFANRAAQLTDVQERTQAVRDLHLTGLLREDSFEASFTVEVGDERTRRIGVWERASADKNAPFIRSPALRDEWFFWASKNRIEPKQGRWRVVLLGESVARGYLYDPHFTVSDALQAMLHLELGSQDIDVVDLAQSNQTMTGLCRMAGQSLALSPDVVVIFAGNNWRNHITDADIPFVECVVREQGAAGLKELLEDWREQAVHNLIRRVNSLLAPRGIKIIWVVPEFNVADWTDPPSGVPHLSGESNQHWRSLDREARLAVQEGKYETAEELASKMTALDGGTSSVPLRMLANCRQLRGDVDGTRRYLELCRDAEGWDPSFSYSPRTSVRIQEAIRSAVSYAGNFVIDLPEAIRRHLETALPDRRVFLEYCHLTTEGIAVAVAAMAAQITSLLTNRAYTATTLLGKFSPPPDKVEGKASFLAAVHNAHFYQRADVVGYWLDRAVRLWPESSRLMTRFIDCATRNVPMDTCRSGLELAEMDELGTLRYLTRGNARRLDLTLCDAVVACVAKVGIDMRREVAELRTKTHSIGKGPRELTEFYYASATPSVFERGWISSSLPTNRASHSMYSSAFWDSSRLVFYAERAGPVRVRLTYRVPLSSGDGLRVAIDVNDQYVTDLAAGPAWLTSEIAIPESCIVEGMNVITVGWPAEDVPSALLLNQAADHLIARRLPSFFRVFGEIHSLSVSDPGLSSTSIAA